MRFMLDFCFPSRSPERLAHARQFVHDRAPRETLGPASLMSFPGRISRHSSVLEERGVSALGVLGEGSWEFPRSPLDFTHTPPPSAAHFVPSVIRNTSEPGMGLCIESGSTFQRITEHRAGLRDPGKGDDWSSPDR